MNRTNFNMKVWTAIVVLFAATVTLAGCGNDESVDKVKMVEMTIYSETGYGSSILSDVWTEPLCFSESGDTQKQLLLDIITEGFDFEYERGYEYTFKAKKVWMANPPMDVASVKYLFVGPLTKTKVITEDSEEDMTVSVSPETIRFMPCYPYEYDENGDVITYDAMRVKAVNSDSWMALKEIEGFDFESGCEYTLNIKKITQAEPYSVKYVLLNVLDKQKPKA